MQSTSFALELVSSLMDSVCIAKTSDAHKLCDYAASSDIMNVGGRFWRRDLASTRLILLAGGTGLNQQSTMIWAP